MADLRETAPDCVILDTPTGDVTTFCGHAQSQRSYSHSMAVSTTPARGKSRTSPGGSVRKRKGKKRPWWLAQWWPLLLGILVTPLALHGASIMALAGPRALTSLYPWTVLLENPFWGLHSRRVDEAAQLLMYIQFPVYGLLTSIKLRTRPFSIAFGLALALHIVGILAVVVSTARF